MAKLRCDICHSDKKIRHLSMPLCMQEKEGPHPHICDSCLRGYYTKELSEKLISIDKNSLIDIRKKQQALQKKK